MLSEMCGMKVVCKKGVDLAQMVAGIDEAFGSLTNINQ